MCGTPEIVLNQLLFSLLSLSACADCLVDLVRTSNPTSREHCRRRHRQFRGGKSLSSMPLEQSRIRRGTTAVESLLLTNGINYAVVFVYACANLLLFMHSARLEHLQQEDFRRYSTAFARGCGAILNLNFAVVLLISSRSLVSFFRETPLSRYASLDHLMPGVHSIIGNFILFAGAGHVFAHLPTYIIQRTWGSGYSGGTSLFATGTALCLLLLVVRVSALENVRRRYYEAFRRFHVGGCVSIYVVLCIHGLHKGQPSTWKWVLGPLLLYSLDRGLRMLQEKRSYLFISKHSAIFQGRSVLRLRLPRVFHFQAGQYAELKVPAISKFQWHPFTIASAPHEAEMVFYVKAAGNWTTELMLLFAERLGEENAEDIEVHIAGPFGAPAQHVNRFDRLVLIGGGVGSTPFCSVVKSLDHWMTQWAREQPPVDGKQGEKFSRKYQSRDVQKIPITGGEHSAGSQPTRSCHTEEQDTFYTAPEVSETIEKEARREVPIFNAASNHLRFKGDRQGQSQMSERSQEREISIRSEKFAASLRASRRNNINEKRRQNPKSVGLAVGKSAEDDWEQISRGSTVNGSYWHAVHSLALLEGQSTEMPTYRTSLDQLIGMSFGSHRFIQHLQTERLIANTQLENDMKPSNVPIRGDPSKAADEFSIFHDRRVRFLMYMKSVTSSVGILLLLILRVVIVAVAAIFQFIDEDAATYGLSIYNTMSFVVVDTVITLIVALGVAVPSIVEGIMLRFRGPVPWVDICLLSPAVTFAFLINVLTILDVSRDHGTLVRAVSFFVSWPLTYILFLIRFFAVIGERIALGEPTGRRDLASTKSVDFFWTSPTTEDDHWLVEELSRSVKSPQTSLHRFITRMDPPAGGASAMGDKMIKTNYGRPNWDSLFNSISERSENGSTIGVFLCGPASMAEEVQESVGQSMRNSIVRGLQYGGATGMKRLEEIFGEGVSANEYTGDTLGKLEDGLQTGCGCNIKMILHKEKFS